MHTLLPMHTLMIWLAPGSINHIANIVKGYAIAIGIAFAMYMFVRWWQIRQREAGIEKAARARAVWSRHLAIALQHPELAEPMNGSLASPIEAARYRTFVASLLTSADEILALEPTDAWRQTLARHLGPHKSFLTSAEAHDTLLRDCSPASAAIVNRLVQG